MPRVRRNRAPIREESDDSNDDEALPTQQHPSDDEDEEEDHPDASLNRDEDCSPAHATSTNSPDENTLRILLSTDNHLGYLERDPVRGYDSFAALEEVLSIARSNHVDLVLLSGDVFHENKPSRRTLHATMEIFRRYCMGGESVGFQIVSDQSECLRSVVTGRANYEDEFYSVDLPIFAIHGNHDDPTRDGGTEMLSALDLLSVSNLINYFGRQDQVDNIQVSPVLLQKGETKVALYGMGSMRDERLNRMWQGKKVRFLRPEEDTTGNRQRRNDEATEDDDEENGASNLSSWFNIFTLHQNRDLGRGSKNCVHESMIPEWMDLVVWGHEHECLINPAESLVGTFRITQPGSSVATSLTMGEARRKHVGVLDIRGQQFRLKPVPLESVRSFALGDASLSDWVRDGKLDREDPKVEERMSDLLAEEVEKLIQRAREDAELLRQDLEAQAQTNLDIEDEFDPDKRVRKFTLQFPEQVLVRLKVEHSGFATLNNQRFGSRFVGEVANPSDILLFHKKRQAENATTKGAAAKKKQAKGLNIPSEPEELEEINVEDLVNDNLINSDKKLELLNEKDMAEALDDFVAKELRQAIGDKTAQCLKASQKILKNRGKKEGDDDEVAVDNPTAIREFCMSKSEKIRAELALEREEAAEKKKKEELDKSRQIIKELNSPGNYVKSHNNGDSSGEEDNYLTSTNKSKPVTTSKKSTAKSRKNVYDDSDDDIEEDSPPPKKRGTVTKAKASTTNKKSPRKRAITHVDSSDDEVQFAGTSQASTKRATRTARSAAKKAQYNYDDSDIEEIDDDEEKPPPTKKQSTKKAPSQSQATITAFTSARKPAGRGRSTVKRNYLDEDSDDDDDEPLKSVRGGWGTASSQNMAAKRGRR